MLFEIYNLQTFFDNFLKIIFQRDSPEPEVSPKKSKVEADPEPEVSKSEKKKKKKKSKSKNEEKPEAAEKAPEAISAEDVTNIAFVAVSYPNST